MTDEQLREKLAAAGAQRVRARGALHKVDGEVAELLRAVRDSPRFTMDEAATLIGEPHRTRCYHLITKDDKRKRGRTK